MTMGLSITAIGYSGKALGEAMSIQKHLVDENRICSQSFMDHVIESLQGLELLGSTSSRTLEVASASRASAHAPASGIPGSAQGGSLSV